MNKRQSRYSLHIYKQPFVKYKPVFNTLTHRFSNNKRYIRLLNIRIIQGRQQTYVNPATYVCANCGIEFTGNYCNNCGQKYNTVRLTYKSVLENVLGGITNIGNGFFSTMLELFIRPGYLIHDFIRGRRVIYFKPFQMLFVLAAIYAVCSQLLYPPIDEKKKENAKEIVQKGSSDSLKEEDKEKENEDDWLDFTIEGVMNALDKGHPYINYVVSTYKKWLSGNKAIEILWTLPVFVLATSWAFRKRKNYRSYNYVELAFLRGYVSCQILIASIVLLPFGDKTSEGIPFWLEFVFAIWIYFQIFKGTIMGTAKRVLLMYLYYYLILLMLAVLVVAVLVLYAYLFANK